MFGIPGMINTNRRIVRAPDNPMDRCSVISIFPKEIDETKATIQPGRFIIPPGTYEKPSILVVGPSSWWKELEEEAPLLEIPTGSIQIADSIVRDYSNGLLGCNMGDSMPGLFYLPGIVTPVELITKYKPQLDSANIKQRKWFSHLIIMADGLWSQSRGNPLAIDDHMRLAARELGQNTKEWLADFRETETVRCVGCGSLRNPKYPICASCHQIIDRKLYDSLKISSLEFDKVK